MARIKLRINEILVERGRTAYWLANQVGMTHGGFFKVRHGRIKALNLELLARLCEVLECEPGELFALSFSKPKQRKKSRSL